MELIDNLDTLKVENYIKVMNLSEGIFGKRDFVGKIVKTNKERYWRLKNDN